MKNNEPLYAEFDESVDLAGIGNALASSISGHVAEWPQLKPALYYLAEEVKELRNELAEKTLELAAQDELLEAYRIAVAAMSGKWNEVFTNVCEVKRG